MKLLSSFERENICENMIQMPSRYKWDNFSMEIFHKSSSYPTIQRDINQFLEKPIEPIERSINEAINFIHNIIKSASELSLTPKTKNHIKVTKQQIKNGSTIISKRKTFNKKALLLSRYPQKIHL
jgi:hypothetical protein